MEHNTNNISKKITVGFYRRGRLVIGTTEGTGPFLHVIVEDSNGSAWSANVHISKVIVF